MACGANEYPNLRKVFLLTLTLSRITELEIRSLKDFDRPPIKRDKRVAGKPP